MYQWSFVPIWELQILHLWTHCNVLVNFDWLCFVGFVEYTMMVIVAYLSLFRCFYGDKAETFCRGFAAIESFLHCNIQVWCKQTLWCRWTYGRLILHPVVQCELWWYFCEVFFSCFHLWFSCSIGKKPPGHWWCFMDKYDELTWYLS